MTSGVNTWARVAPFPCNDYRTRQGSTQFGELPTDGAPAFGGGGHHFNCERDDGTTVARSSVAQKRGLLCGLLQRYLGLFALTVAIALVAVYATAQVALGRHGYGSPLATTFRALLGLTLVAIAVPVWLSLDGQVVQKLLRQPIVINFICAVIGSVGLHLAVCHTIEPFSLALQVLHFVGVEEYILIWVFCQDLGIAFAALPIPLSDSLGCRLENVFMRVASVTLAFVRMYTILWFHVVQESTVAEVLPGNSTVHPRAWYVAKYCTINLFWAPLDSCGCKPAG